VEDWERGVEEESKVEDELLGEEEGKEEVEEGVDAMEDREERESSGGGRVE
jgi:hypothetical protein